VPPGQLADARADGTGPGEPDLVQAALGQRPRQAGEGLLAVGEHQVQHAVRQAAAAGEQVIKRAGAG
jgi:hypothetical protein